MARQMESMNLMMPLMSLFFAFTVPAGLTLYWIFGAVVRTIQMYLLNKKFANINLDEIIEKNKEKAQKKKEKRGIKRAQIYEAAKMNTRSSTLSSRANSVKAETTSDDFEYKKTNFKKGSLAEKANLVNEYNHGSNK
jgi:YidC/Oxa1 family membrane protein insertase